MSLTAALPTPRRPRRESLLRWAVVCNTELLLVLVDLALDPVTVTNPIYLALPFVWINAALWAVWRVDWAPAPNRRRLLAGAVGVGYFLVLAWVGGLFMVGGHPPGTAGGFGVRLSLPVGWGPVLTYAGSGLVVTLTPFKLVGYAALAYLAGATVLDALGSAVTGVLGLFSCVSCTWPVLGTVVTGVFGGSSVVAAVATGQPYLASTAVFLSAVGLLVWRPTIP